MNYLDKGFFVETSKGSIMDKYKFLKEVSLSGNLDWARDFGHCVPGLRKEQPPQPQGHQKSLKEEHR